MSEIIYSSLCETGDIRSSNQDKIICRREKICGHEAGMFAVADGMGGLSYGEEISFFIVSQLDEWWNTELKTILQKKDWIEKLNIGLDNKIIDMNKTAISFGRQMQKKSGSTLSLLVLVDAHYVVKHLGDSRIYLYHKKRLRSLTVDQALSAKRNVLTMCVGIFDKLDIITTVGYIGNGDRFLLCSDGLHHAMEEVQLLKLLSCYKMSLDKTVNAIRRTIEYGAATDNISIILVQYKNNCWLRIFGKGTQDESRLETE